MAYASGGLRHTVNNGISWGAFSKGLTSAAVHDIVVQPEAKDLLIETHGRSIYKTNISALQANAFALVLKKSQVLTLIKETTVNIIYLKGNTSFK